MVSKASLAQLRISQEDLLDADDLLYGDYVDPISAEVDGRDIKEDDERLIWIRHRLSSSGHRLSPAREYAYCGMPMALDDYWYEQEYRPWHERWFKEDPGDWFIAIDRRKGGKCTGCKPKNANPDKRYLDDDPVPTPAPDTSARFVPQSPAEEREHMKFLSKVAWVANQLGATIE